MAPHPLCVSNPCFAMAGLLLKTPSFAKRDTPQRPCSTAGRTHRTPDDSTDNQTCVVLVNNRKDWIMSNEVSVTPALLSRLEAAAYLGVSPTTVGRLTLRGELKQVRLGKKKGCRVAYRKRSLDAFIDSNEQ